MRKALLKRNSHFFNKRDYNLQYMGYCKQMDAMLEEINSALEACWVFLYPNLTIYYIYQHLGCRTLVRMYFNIWSHVIMNSSSLLLELLLKCICTITKNCIIYNLLASCFRQRIIALVNCSYYKAL